MRLFPIGKFGRSSLHRKAKMDSTLLLTFAICRVSANRVIVFHHLFALVVTHNNRSIPLT